MRSYEDGSARLYRLPHWNSSLSEKGIGLRIGTRWQSRGNMIVNGSPVLHFVFNEIRDDYGSVFKTNWVIMHESGPIEQFGALIDNVYVNGKRDVDEIQAGDLVQVKLDNGVPHLVVKRA